MTYAFVPAGLLSLAFAAVRTAIRVSGRAVSILQNRNAVQRLTELDDRALKDIGLVRSDVAGALAEPLHVDPSQILRLRRGERERRLRAVPVTRMPGHPARPSAVHG